MHTHILFILSLVFLWFNTTTATSLGHQLVTAVDGAANTCIDKERQALLDFKVHLQDPDDRLSTWRPEEETDCCQWHGVMCNNETGHVTELNLRSNSSAKGGLRGEISLSLLNLTYLHRLDLYDNSFHGTIPMVIANMIRLTFLDLGKNNFSGTIPASIGSLANLEYLCLSHNSLYGTIPPQFGNLANLLELHLISIGSCTVENLDWLPPLSKLQQLELDGTSLVKANNWVNVILGLQNLSVLSLRGCNLSQVMHPYHSSVNSSPSIVTLHLDDNNLNLLMYSNWLSPLIGNRLKELTLSHNTFDGKLSNFFNSLSGSTSAMIQYLDVSSNKFTGSLSNEIQNFSSLTHLNLSSNMLDGTISDKLWELSRLQELDLSSNSLTGAISVNIGKSSLLYIDLSMNLLEGLPFNADMSNLSKNVEYINFSSCKLGPRFPKWIKKMKNLSHLDISNNSISDTISREYWIQWRPSRLHCINLSFNNISGTLPDLLSNPGLNSVDLSFNSFYGPIPSFPPKISFINLSRNKFYGGISFLCQMYDDGLEFLDLSRNSLTGQLPDCLGTLSKLTILNLGHNFLSGKLPPSLRYLDQLEMLCLYNNSFSGELPLSLRNCTKLSLLDVGANKFTGHVPVWIGENFPGLYYLNLRSNNFFGRIPWQFCQLGTLQILDMSINNLQGPIPSCVNNFTAMVQKGFFVKQTEHHYRWLLDAMSANISYSSQDEINNNYVDNAMIEWQGKVNEFSSNLRLVKAIDLSSNNLTGKIPNEFTSLHGLLVLDLSHNALTGEIPQDIGHMKELLTLNLSRNMFSGEIPSTMSHMDRLNDLDVSYNNLSGRVPSSTQLQSFEPDRFTGNAGLCGLPTTEKCLGDEELGSESEGDGKSTEEFWRWFYIGLANGFATTFWITSSVLLLKGRLRHALFHVYDCSKDWVYIKVAVLNARLQRIARAF